LRHKWRLPIHPSRPLSWDRLPVIALNYLLSMLVSLLPRRWRQWFSAEFDMWPAAAACGIGQYVTCVVCLFIRYVNAMQRTLEGFASATVAQGREEALGIPAVQYGAGFVALMQFICNPLSLLLFYLILEGLLRFLAAVVAHEIIGTLPLYLIACGCARIKGAAAGS
jgi:hypothetical protein